MFPPEESSLPLFNVTHMAPGLDPALGSGSLEGQNQLLSD